MRFAFDDSSERRDTSFDENERDQTDITWVSESYLLDASNPYRIAVPILEEAEVNDVERVLRTGEAIARDRNGELLILCLVTVPEQTPLELIKSDEKFASEARATTEQLTRSVATTNVPVHGVVCLTHKEPHAIVQMTERYACDAVLMNIESGGSQRRRLLKGDTVEKVTARAKCDVFVEKFGERSEPAKHIFVPVSGGPNSGLATEITRALARAAGAHVDVIHFLHEDVSDDQRAEAEQMLQGAAHILNDLPHIDTSIIETDNTAKEIISRSDEYDVTVFGAPTKGLLKQFVYGTVPDSVQQKTDNEVLMVKQNTERNSVYYRWIAGDDPTETSFGDVS